MNRSRTHSWGCECAPSSFAFPGSQPVFERPRPFFVRHLALDLDLLVDEKAVSAVATLHFERVDTSASELVLDAVGFEIAEVLLSTDGTFEPAQSVYDGTKLRVRIAEDRRQFSVRIAYRVKPQRGLYFISPDEHVPDKPRQVWTQCQDEDARHFVPCHDKPNVRMTFELLAKVPRGWQCLSNGDLVECSCEPKDAKWTYRWQMNQPLPSYLITIVAGEFSCIEGGRVGSVPVSYWVPKGREREGEQSFRRTPEMIRSFGERLGVEFPFAKYTQVVVSDFTFGGMENTTATTMHDRVLLDDRARLDITSDDLIAHELAHQWFGDYVTCRDWNHAWLNEGFATFMEHVDRQLHLGDDEYRESLRTDRETYLAEARDRYRRPIVCREYENPIDLFDRHLYQKAGIVLHMLRVRLGDDAFFLGVKSYLTRHGHGIVETGDLLRSLENASGQSLEQFFEQWVYRGGHPELRVKIEYEGGLLIVHVDQTQDDKNHPYVFDLPIELCLRSGKTERYVARIEKASDLVAVPLLERPSYVVVDPQMSILADVTVDAPGDMLEAQLSRASTAHGRGMAASSLAKRADMAAIASLARTLANESEFWATRALAAEGLGRMGVTEAFAVLSSHIRTAHAKVRRAVVRAVGEFRTPEAARLLKAVALADESYLVEAEAARSLGRTRQADVALDTLVEIVDRNAWGDVLRIGALDGMAALRDERAIPHVAARMRYGVSRRARQAAFSALAKLTQERKYRELLEDVLDDRDSLIRAAAARALTEMGDKKSQAALRARLEREDDGRVRRQLRESLQALASSAPGPERDLSDRLETLKAELAEVSLRLKKLESVLPQGKAQGAPDAAEPGAAAGPTGPNDAQRRASRTPRSTIARRKKRLRGKG